MLKVVEIKETLEDTEIINNIYEVNNAIRSIIKQTEFITELNKTDYDYLNIILRRTKINLNKINTILKYRT